MIFKIEEGEYIAHFIHHPPKKDGKGAERKAWTLCIFHEGKCKAKAKECVAQYVSDKLFSEAGPVAIDAVHGIGEAHCNPLDQFNKPRGRIVSLGRAMESFPRKLRTAVWAEYFKISPRPKSAKPALKAKAAGSTR